MAMEPGVRGSSVWLKEREVMRNSARKAASSQINTSILRCGVLCILFSKYRQVIVHSANPDGQIPPRTGKDGREEMLDIKVYGEECFEMLSSAHDMAIAPLNSLQFG